MMSGPFFRKDVRLTQADRATGSSEPSPQGFFPDDRPAVTVDCVVFGYDGEELKLLLVERRGEPFAATWALPGGFVRADESLEAAAIRELREETGVADLYLEQLYTFGAPQRDPRIPPARTAGCATPEPLRRRVGAVPRGACSSVRPAATGQQLS